MNAEAPAPEEDREPDVDTDVQDARPNTVVATPIEYGTPGLPRNGNAADWSPAERATVEAAGLVFTYPDYHALKGTKVLAPIPIVERFLALCTRTGLDPLARQIYCIPRLGRGGIEWAVQTGIDGFRVVAERTKLYRGRDPFLWMAEDGSWVEAFVPKFHGKHPLAARATVYRDGWDRPIVAIAEWESYKQTKANGELTAMWEKQGSGQLAKCAEALALRTMFPQDLSGVYTDDETAGPAQAIANDRASELAARDWRTEVEACETPEDLADIEDAMIDQDAPPAAFALLLSRKATLRQRVSLRTVVPEGDNAERVNTETPPARAPRGFSAAAMTPTVQSPAEAPQAVTEPPVAADDEWVDPEIAKHEAELAAQEAGA